MKSLKFALLAVVVSSFATSCTLYEDGPLVSLLSKEDRIANTWVAEEVIEADGDVVTDDYEGWIWVFTEGGSASVTYPVLGSSITFDGNWNLTDNDEVFQLIVDYGIGNDIADFDILRLAADEFWVLDENGTEFRLKTK